MKYINPIVKQDMSDPDVIKYKDGYLMVTSSFNFVPGLPLYYSKDLINWKFVQYIVKRLPTKKFNNVHFGHGIWAPSIRIHKDKIYVLLPFPDEGIYVCSCKDPFKKWSKPRRLLKVKGFEDPCPIWFDDKAYIVHAFVKSRIGFNSKLAIFEADENLKKVTSKSKIIYDGTIDNKTIEGPKFNVINNELFILAPAGGVENGYQVALKSNNIYGPYEYKIILKGYEDTINGPHQGALVEYEKDKYVFYHFQEKGALGRILHVQEARVIDGYPLVGKIREDNIGSPEIEHKYYLKRHTFSKNDNRFSIGDFLNDFTYPCNKVENSYFIDNTFNLNALFSKSILKNKNSIYKAIPSEKFNFVSHFSFATLKEDEEAGAIILGLKSHVLKYKDDKFYLIELDMESNKSKILYEKRALKKEYIIKVKVNDLKASFYIDNRKIGESYNVSKGKWVGAKIGIFARSNNKKEECGFLKIHSSYIK